MRYSGLQPQYFPRLHYFARVLSADIFVIRDDVQFVRKHKYPDGKVGKSYQVHSPIKKAEGLHLLTVPVKHDGFQPLTKTEVIYDTTWIADQLKTLALGYHKSPNVSVLLPELTALLYSRYKTLAELNTATILWGMLRLLGEESVTPDKLTLTYVTKKLQEQETVRLKQLKLECQTYAAQHSESKKNDRIIALCKEVGATEDYCGGTATAAYVDHAQFAKAGITITVQDWQCHEYTQQFTKQQGFISNLSIIDLLMNVPQKQAANIINGKKMSAHKAAPVLLGYAPFEPEAMVLLTDVMLSLQKGLLYI